MSLLLLFDDTFIDGQPGTVVEMTYEDMAEVKMIFEDGVEMIFEG